MLFHHDYTSAADALAPLVLAMILLSISVVLTMYLLAVGRRWVAGVLVGGAAALTAAVVQVHGCAAGDRLRRPGRPGAVLVVIVAGFAVVHRVRLGEQSSRANLTRWVTTPGRSSPRPVPATGPNTSARTSRCWPRSPPERASGASTSWPGGTSTTPRRAGPSYTPTRSRRCGPRRGSTSRSAPRPSRRRRRR